MDGSSIDGPGMIKLLLMDQSFLGREILVVREAIEERFNLSYRQHYHCFSRGSFQCKGHWYDDTKYNCVSETQKCNGIPECPDGSDEEFELCQDSFSSSASLTICEAADIFNNKTVTIKAVQCNGIAECLNRSDEIGCGIDNRSFTITVVIGALIISIASILLTLHIDISGVDEGVHGNASFETFENERLQAYVVLGQRSRERKFFNQTFYQYLMKVYENNRGEALNYLKVQMILIEGIQRL